MVPHADPAEQATIDDPAHDLGDAAKQAHVGRKEKKVRDAKRAKVV